MKNKLFTLTNLLLVALIVLASIFIYITYGTYKKFSYEQERMEAFYITNAGINQAIWYLSTPKNLGGYGPSWRTKNMNSYFSTGSYVISVENGEKPGEIIITSVGNARGLTLSLQATVLYARSIPKVFDYALFSGGELEIGGNSNISGNILINDNLKIKKGVIVKDGEPTTAKGYNVFWEEKPEFKNILSKKKIPVLPVLDTTYYYNKISTAKASGVEVLQGDQAFSTLNLDGKTIYVNGNVTIKGSVKGHGEIVCTRNMEISGSGNIDDGIYFICNGKLNITGKHSVNGNSYFYSKQKLSIDKRTIINGGAVVLSPTIVEVDDESSFSGLIYSPSVKIGKDTILKGSIAADNFTSASKAGAIADIDLSFNQNVLPLNVLGFNVESKIVMRKPGSLKEI